MPRIDEIATDIVNDGTTPASPTRRRRMVLFWDDSTRSVDVPPRGTMTIGRAATCAVSIDHRSVSRVHAALHVGESLVLEDLGSANGTFVDGRRLAASERVPLAYGSVARVGLASFVVVDEGERIAEAPSGAMRKLDQLADLVATSDI